MLLPLIRSSEVISALEFRSEGLWFVAQSLPWCSFLRQETLFHTVFFHPGVKMGTGNLLLGVTLQQIYILSRGSSNTLSYFMLQKPSYALAVWVSCGSCVPLPFPVPPPPPPLLPPTPFPMGCLSIFPLLVFTPGWREKLWITTDQT